MSATENFQISQIGQIAIDVQELDRAVAFYRDVLGLPLLFQVPPGLAFFQCGTVRLMMEQPQGNQMVTRATSIIYYQVDDLDATYAAMRAKGVQLIDTPHLVAQMADHELWMFFCYDSEENTVAFMHEKR